MNRTLLSALLALTLVGSAAVAQQQTAPADAAPIVRRHAPDPARETAHLTKQLNLTPDQSARLQPILADRDQKLADLRASTSLSRKDMHHQMKTIHEGTMQQLSSILTPEQMQQMKAMRHRHGGEGHQGQQTTPAPGL